MGTCVDVGTNRRVGLAVGQPGVVALHLPVLLGG